MLVCERVSMRVTGVRGEELKGGLLYVLYLCNQRDMLMLFFSFLSPGVLRLGWEREGTEGKRYRVWPHSGPWQTICSFLSSYWGGFRQMPPSPQVDLHIVRAQSTESIFAFSRMPRGPNFWD